jgi:cell division protein FtsB
MARRCGWTGAWSSLRFEVKPESIDKKVLFIPTITWLNRGEMSVGQSVWDKLFRLVLVLLVVASVLGIILWYEPVIEQNQRMRADKLALDQKIETESETARKLDLELRALQNPTTIERLARERLSYAKPGENVIHFDPPAGTRTE